MPHGKTKYGVIPAKCERKIAYHMSRTKLTDVEDVFISPEIMLEYAGTPKIHSRLCRVEQKSVIPPETDLVLVAATDSPLWVQRRKEDWYTTFRFYTNGLQARKASSPKAIQRARNPSPCRVFRTCKATQSYPAYPPFLPGSGKERQYPRPSHIA